MDCSLLGTKPLSVPIEAFSQLEPWEQISMKFQSKYKNILSRKYTWKCVQIVSHFDLASVY